MPAAHLIYSDFMAINNLLKCLSCFCQTQPQLMSSCLHGTPFLRGATLESLSSFQFSLSTTVHLPFLFSCMWFISGPFIIAQLRGVRQIVFPIQHLRLTRGSSDPIFNHEFEFSFLKSFCRRKIE